MSDFDRLLMQQVQTGDLDAFEELAGRYRRAMLRTAASKLGDDAWAEDIVQETLLAVYAARHTYNATFSFRTWLWTILLNLCRRQWQRRSRRPAAASLAELTPMSLERIATSEDSPPAALLKRERTIRLKRLLDELPERQADAIRLRFFGGLQFAEIAEAMGSSLNGAKMRVKTGLEKLSRRLAPLLGDDDEL